jgi:hypothetical protein
MLTVGIGMLASLFVGVVMEFVKLQIQARHKKRDQEAKINANVTTIPPSATSGGFCAVPGRPVTLPGLPPEKKVKRKKL